MTNKKKRLNKYIRAFSTKNRRIRIAVTMKHKLEREHHREKNSTVDYLFHFFPNVTETRSLFNIQKGRLRRERVTKRRIQVEKSIQ